MRPKAVLALAVFPFGIKIDYKGAFGEQYLCRLNPSKALSGSKNPANGKMDGKFVFDWKKAEIFIDLFLLYIYNR